MLVHIAEASNLLRVGLPNQLNRCRKTCSNAKRQICERGRDRCYGERLDQPNNAFHVLDLRSQRSPMMQPAMHALTNQKVVDRGDRPSIDMTRSSAAGSTGFKP